MPLREKMKDGVELGQLAEVKDPVGEIVDEEQPVEEGVKELLWLTDA